MPDQTGTLAGRTHTESVAIYATVQSEHRLACHAASRRGYARRFWQQWYRRAIRSRIELLKKFARKLKRYLPGILSHCRWRLHTSLLEGINNKIKVIKRMAYGYRDDEYFFLKIRQAFPGVGSWTSFLGWLLSNQTGFYGRDLAVGELVCEEPLLIEAFDLSQIPVHL